MAHPFKALFHFIRAHAMVNQVHESRILECIVDCEGSLALLLVAAVRESAEVDDRDYVHYHADAGPRQIRCSRVEWEN
jgi:hypothetical protein